MYKYIWYCRWCGATTPNGKTERDGFCPGGKCKQAHHRAFKKYRQGVIRALERRSTAGKSSNAKQGKKKAR